LKEDRRDEADDRDFQEGGMSSDLGILGMVESLEEVGD
jgi:hypothetical protein